MLKEWGKGASCCSSWCPVQGWGGSWDQVLCWQYIEAVYENKKFYFGHLEFYACFINKDSYVNVM